ncbi:hypothetical protein PSNTI_37310 [Stutzerimonas stutzeri]|nr:hypothetical protein PSNTI_37310 [Stutzerimonas stutzeri]
MSTVRVVFAIRYGSAGAGCGEAGVQRGDQCTASGAAGWSLLEWR